MDKSAEFNKKQIKNPKLSEIDLRAGDTVKVYQKIKEGDKERIQIFEGVVIARKHGKGINATFTVRKISDGVGVERIFPLHAPFIEKLEITKRAKVKRAKLYYLRNLRGKKAKLKQKQFEGIIIEEEKELAPNEIEGIVEEVTAENENKAEEKNESNDEQLKEKIGNEEEKEKK